MKKILSLILVFLIVFPLFSINIYGDTIVSDGDGLVPISSSNVNFGKVALGKSKSSYALFAIKKSNIELESFKSGSNVNISCTQNPDNRLQINFIDSSINLDNWDTTSYDQLSIDNAKATLTLSIQSNDIPRTYSSILTIEASGVNNNNENITCKTYLTVNYTISDDTTPPQLSTPENLCVEAQDSTGSIVNFELSAIDDVDKECIIESSHQSNSKFPLGQTTVTCTACDLSGNSTTKSFDVQVKDTTSPILHVPSSVVVEAQDEFGSQVNFIITANDSVDNNVKINLSHEQNSKFPIGKTIVSATAVDFSGNQVSNSFEILVLEKIAPTLILPNDITIEATSKEGAQVFFDIQSKDNFDSNVIINTSYTSGSIFPITCTQVFVTSTDSNGNTAQGSFFVNVIDSTAPNITVPNNINIETDKDGEYINFETSSYDIVDGQCEVLTSHESGSFFNVGETIITCKSKDSHNNESTKTFTITITKKSNTDFFSLLLEKMKNISDLLRPFEKN